MTEVAPDSHADAFPPAPSEARVRVIKAVVIGLAVLILLAFAGVVWGMVYRAGRIGKGADGAAGPTVGSAVARPGAGAGDRALQPEIDLELPAGARIISTALDGPRLLVHHQSASGTGLTVVDLETGRVVSRVRIRVPAP